MKSITIRKAAEKLLSKVSGYWDNVPDCDVTEDTYARLINDLARLMNTGAYNLFQSCLPLIGKPQTKEELFKVCYFIRANKDLLKEKIVPMGFHRIPDGLHEMRITNALRKDPEFVSLELLVTTGPCAMSKTRINGVSLNKAQIWIHNLGYSVRSEKFYPGPTAMSFIGCYALLDYNAQRKFSPDNKMGPIEIVYSEEVQKYNRQYIIKPRRGLSDCPFGLTEKITLFPDYCWNWCLRGQVECPASYHEHNYIIGPCRVCKGEKTPIDPELPGECQQCRRKRLGITDFD